MAPWRNSRRRPRTRRRTSGWSACCDAWWRLRIVTIVVAAGSTTSDAGAGRWAGSMHLRHRVARRRTVTAPASPSGKCGRALRRSSPGGQPCWTRPIWLLPWKTRGSRLALHARFADDIEAETVACASWLGQPCQSAHGAAPMQLLGGHKFLSRTSDEQRAGGGPIACGAHAPGKAACRSTWAMTTRTEGTSPPSTAWGLTLVVARRRGPRRPCRPPPSACNCAPGWRNWRCEPSRGRVGAAISHRC